MTHLDLAPVTIDCTRAAKGWILRSTHPLPDGPVSVLHWLEHWATVAPEHAFLIDCRSDAVLQRISYGEAWRAIHAIGSALLELGASARAPVAILSGNSVAHALVALAAMAIGAPAAPISAAYSQASQDFARLKSVVELLKPGVVFAEDPAASSKAIAAADLGQRPIVGAIGRPGALALADLLRGDGSASRKAFAHVRRDTVAKVLFTSGSTGQPRGVLTTHRMMVSNQEALAAVWTFLHTHQPTLVDWLPWSHTFGGSFCFNLVLRNGGTLHIDDGRPIPAGFARSLANLRELSPTLYFNVPSAYALLADALLDDADLRRRFFSRLKLAFFAAAALPPAIRHQFERAAALAGREDLFFASAWGTTETAPMSTIVHAHTSSPANIGWPAPGVDIRLAACDASDGKFEICVRGPNVTPGYWEGPENTREIVTDDQGFYRTGDAVAFVDDDDPLRGLAFVGRLGENFKLTSGTWVTVGRVRIDVLDYCGGLVRDVVVTGENRDDIGVLVFPGPDWVESERATSRARLLERLRAYAADHPHTSACVRRALVSTTPLSLDRGETTDKGYTNQRRVLDLRRDDVERLHADDPDAEVLRV